MTRQMKLALCVALISGGLSGCASILSSRSYPVSIQSSPADASFTITNSNGVVIHNGKTPTTVTLEAGAGFFQAQNYTITYKKDGYQSQTTTLKPGIDGWYIGNILFGGIIGILVVDPATGAMWKLPPTANGSLGEMQSSNDENMELKIVSLETLNDEQKSSLMPL